MKKSTIPEIQSQISNSLVLPQSYIPIVNITPVLNISQDEKKRDNKLSS